MLIAEDFVLLALDPDGTPARGASYQSAVVVGVTGALITELALEGHLDIADGRIRVTGTVPAHPLLAQALDNTRRHEGKKLKNRLGSIKHSGWNEVVDGMVAAGVVGREKSALKPTRHPPLNPGYHAQMLGHVRGAAAGDGPIDVRTACLLALSGPCQLLEVVAPDRKGRKHAKRRIAESADQVPAAAAVKAVIQAAQAAVAAGSTAAVVAASSG